MFSITKQQKKSGRLRDSVTDTYANKLFAQFDSVPNSSLAGGDHTQTSINRGGGSIDSRFKSNLDRCKSAVGNRVSA